MAVLRAYILKIVPALLILILSAASAFAQSSTELEYKIKAGLVYNFLKYSDWKQQKPANGDSGTVNVCTYGKSAISEYLFQMHGRTAQQYVINMKEISSLENGTDCNFVYIGASKKTDIEEVIHFFDRQPVILISDIPSFSTMGGMVELSTQQDKRIHLYINKTAMQKSGIQIQPRLLKLAERMVP